MGKYTARKAYKARSRNMKQIRESPPHASCNRSIQESYITRNGESHERYSSCNGESVHIRPSPSMSALGGSQQNMLPYRLRASTISGAANAVSGMSRFISGYRVVSLHLMENCMNAFLKKHKQVSPSCLPQMHFMPQKEEIRGMCISEFITCEKCHFTSGPNKLYSEVNTDAPKGRRAGDLNVRLALGVQNTGVGVREVRELFAVLDVPVPSASSLQTMCNKTGDTLVSLSDQIMAENRRKVKRVMDVWNEPKLIVESDTSYNNSIKGRSFYQPGTQAFCPLIEQITPKKLIIAHNIKNKLCRRCQLYGKNHADKCTANYPKYEPIGNAEMALAQDNMEDLLKDGSGLIPSVVVTDNDGKIVKGMNSALKANHPNKTIEKEDCEIHVSRGQRRKCLNQPWSEQFAGKKNTPARQGFIQDLTNAVVKRCTFELKAVKSHAGQKDFISTVEQAKGTIVPCFKGNHSNCRKSYVCPAHFHRKVHARHLPGKQYLRRMTSSDIHHLQIVIDYKLGSTMIARQRHVTNTNKCEAIHNKIFRAVPKNKTFSRNVNGRTSTQIIAASLGRDTGIKRSCSASQAPLSSHGPGQKILSGLHKQDVYVQTWHNKPETKRQRKQSDYRRKYKSRARGSLYSSNHLHPTVASEHDYAQNVS